MGTDNQAVPFPPDQRANRPEALSVGRARIDRMNIQVPLPADPITSTVYTDWVRAYEPDAESAAHRLAEEVRTGLPSAYHKPGRFLDGLERRVRDLPVAHLPWFWDTVGHRLCAWHARYAGRAYALARAAERAHALPVDTDWHRANVLLFARAGALPAKELSGHQRWLAGVLDPAEAHKEFMAVLMAWGASPGELPADLARRVRASARAAGLDETEDARVLAQLVGTARGKAVPDTLLDAVAALLARHPQDDDTHAPLIDLFPESRNDAAAWLRLLLRSGAADAAAAGRVTPDGGLAGWLGRYTHMYSHCPVAGGGVIRQPMPPELFELVTRFAPRLRAAGTPVTLHEDRRRWPGLDADLLDACLAESIAVRDPGDAIRLSFWGERSRRDLKALAADPVFGRRLEGTVHAALRGGGTAITRLPENAGIAAEVHTRIESLLGALRGGGLAAADEAADELAELLDRPTATALGGIEEALAALDLTGPLARALRAGLPEELGWPALDTALAGLGPAGAVGMTSTWPVLTVYGTDRAVAVDHAGVRGSCTYQVPDDATTHTVHYVGGQFMVSWTTAERGSYAERAFWSDRPDEVFTPERTGGVRPYRGIIDGGLGFHFETTDGGGRHDGQRVLRPGGREGIGRHELQMSDGRRLWSSEVFASRDDWARVDPLTGERGDDRTLPDFHRTGQVPDGMAVFREQLTLAALPPDAPASPLGQDGRLVGCRVLYRTPYAGPSPTDFLLEGIDGRRGRLRSTRPGRRPWGILRMPLDGEEGVLVDEDNIRCHAVADGSLLWEAQGHPGRSRGGDRHSAHTVGTMVPPAFWHFLAPRDETASKALRAVGDHTVRALLAAAVADGAGTEVRAELPRLLPEVTEPRVVEGVLRAALLAADVLRRRRELSRRVGIMRAGPVVTLGTPVPDTVLVPALSGLLPHLPPYAAHAAQPHPATLTAVAADGRHLRGEIDDETRRLALPAAPAEWTALTGRIDAVAWRAAVETTPADERGALAALLETWSGQPFAEPGGRWRQGRAPERSLAACRSAGLLLASGDERAGTAPFVQPADDPAPEGAEACETYTLTRDDAARLPRLLDLVARQGPLAATPEALTVFSARTGVRRSVAALVLGGLPSRARHDDHQKMLRSAPYKANKTVAHEYDSFCHRLGPQGRRAVLAAGMPEDPAELWEPGGMTAAAARMAEVWADLLGATPYVDEELADALETGLGLHDGWARSLTGGPGAHAGAALPVGGYVLLGRRTGGLELRHAEPDGTAGRWVSRDRPPHLDLASAVAWALTERPVGDPAVAGATALHERLRTGLDAPGTLIPVGWHHRLARAVPDDPSFVPYEGAVLPCPEPLFREDTVASVAYDDGLFVVGVPGADVFLRPSGLADPAQPARAERLCGELGLDGLLEAVRRIQAVYDGGLARMVARVATTPVPPGGYELNPALSAPDLVDEATATLGVGADAAALHLQLLALARPTDQNVRRWNGWTAARHKAAQAELVAVGAVETGRRARAGRSAFVPGDWTELKAPHLPLESAKLAPHLAAADGKEAQGPFSRLLPPLPPHELFARAWADRAVART